MDCIRLQRGESVSSCVEGRISYCTTCKNRLWQLSRTLPDNLQAVIAEGNSEIVLVNYNSLDELDDWIRQFQPQIDAGVLRYVHEQTAPLFHCSKAKNLAHLASTGEFLVNLDADNFIGDTIPTWRTLWMNHYDTLIHGFCGDPSVISDRTNGTFGRIGLPRKYFTALGGYDEQMLPVGHQDEDLIDRARAHGLTIVRAAQSGLSAIRNSIPDKMKYCGSPLDWEKMWRLNRDRSHENLNFGRVVANRQRTPVKVMLNFIEDIEL